MNLRHLVSLLTLSSLAVAACPDVYDYAWVVRSSLYICCVPGSVLLSASASAVSVPVPGLSTLLSLCLYLCLGCPLFYLYLLYAWVHSSVYVCVCYVSLPMPGLSAFSSASAVFVAVPKALKKELIHLLFLDSLGNHVQSTGSSRSIVRSIARPIALPKICSLYRALGLGAWISGVKYRKSYDNTPSRDNLDIRAAIYIE